MGKRDFAVWLTTFTDSISDYKYYIYFNFIGNNIKLKTF